VDGSRSASITAWNKKLIRGVFGHLQQRRNDFAAAQLADDQV
jgi:hypothetical protein